MRLHSEQILSCQHNEIWWCVVDVGVCYGRGVCVVDMGVCVVWVLMGVVWVLCVCCVCVVCEIGRAHV